MSIEKEIVLSTKDFLRRKLDLAGFYSEEIDTLLHIILPRLPKIPQHHSFFNMSGNLREIARQNSMSLDEVRSRVSSNPTPLFTLHGLPFPADFPSRRPALFVTPVNPPPEVTKIKKAKTSSTQKRRSTDTPRMIGEPKPEVKEDTQVKGKLRARDIFNAIAAYVDKHETLDLEKIFPDGKLARVEKAFKDKAVLGLRDIPAIAALSITDVAGYITSVEMFVNFAKLGKTDFKTKTLQPVTPAPALI